MAKEHRYKVGDIVETTDILPRIPLGSLAKVTEIHSRVRYYEPDTYRIVTLDKKAICYVSASQIKLARKRK